MRDALINSKGLILLGGIVVGLVAGLFSQVCDHANVLFEHFILHHHLYKYFGFAVPKHWYTPLFVTPLAFILLTYISERYLPGTGGSGIPSAIVAFRTQQSSLRKRCVSLKIAAGKFVLTALAMLVGASVGREGPTVLLGSAILYSLSYIPMPFFRKEYVQKGLVVAGGAAGIAVAFNAPLGGIMFAIEEHSKTFESQLSKILILTIAISGFVCVQIFGRHAFFNENFLQVNILDYVFVAIVCGMLGGLFGGLFSRFLVAMVTQVQTLSVRNKLAISFLCGLIVVGCGYLTHDQTFGSGFVESNLLIQGQDLGWQYFPLKLLSTLASYVSGISGGLFAPTISVGAGLGSVIAQFFHSLDPGVIAILALVSYFAGVTQTPITCFVIVSEMTGRHDLLFLMIIATGIAEFCSWLVCRESLYDRLADIQEQLHLKREAYQQ